jgi:hypothetical protein
MNKSDLAGIKKELKVENTVLKVGEVYSVYLKKDNQAIIYSGLEYFDRMDSEKQELYLKNFKKILSGALDTRLFELDFVDTDDENNAQKTLVQAIGAKENNFKAESDNIVEKVAQNYKYDTDVVITFLRAEYFKGANKRRSKETDEASDDNVFAFEFMMCSVNKIDHPKKSLQFDFIEKEFKANSVLDSIINLTAPLDGFMFPCFNNNCADVNKIMYYTDKPKNINMDFVKKILNCEFKKTAEQEKVEFSSILKGVIGEKIAPETMQTIYENLAKKLEDEGEVETPAVTLDDIKDVLEDSGIDDITGFEEAYTEVAGDTGYEFKVQNIIPDMGSKSMKISTEGISLSFRPKELKNIRKVVDSKGCMCLVIELLEDVDIDGFKLEVEKI